MTKANQDLYTTGGFAPLRVELNVDQLTIEGNWPQDISGSLYRIGPNPQFDPIEPYNPLLGDGMVHAFHVRGRQVSYLNRWVRTRQWTLEHRAGRALFATSGVPAHNDPQVAGIVTDGVANTNLVWHAGKLLALEEGHAPIELDPDTLETRGPWTFVGALPGNMSAHPKLDPETGEMLFFANFPQRTFDGDVAWYVADAAGVLTRQGRFRAPFPGLIHDFVATRDFLVFPFGPVTLSLTRAMRGGPPLAWEPGRGTHLGVLRRDGCGEVRWFSCEPCFAWHMLNGWNNGETITVEGCRQDAPAFPCEDGTFTDPEGWRQYLTRWELNWSQPRAVAIRRLWDEVCEYPRFDERFAMGPIRHGYLACNGGPGTGDPFHRGIAHFEHSRDQMTTFRFPATHAVSEPVFVPRSESAGEGDGFLLCLVYQEDLDRSYLALFDAGRIDQGPQAKAMLDHRVPMGFHGCWLPYRGRSI
jgi:carotenoid cleavage dioxygenase